LVDISKDGKVQDDNSTQLGTIVINQDQTIAHESLGVKAGHETIESAIPNMQLIPEEEEEGEKMPKSSSHMQEE